MNIVVHIKRCGTESKLSFTMSIDSSYSGILQEEILKYVDSVYPGWEVDYYYIGCNK